MLLASAAPVRSQAGAEVGETLTILQILLLLGAVEKELNQMRMLVRHAAYSRGTGGGPPTPPAPGKFFNDWTFNDRPFNDQTFNDQTSNDQTSNDQTFNDRTFNASVQS